MTTHSVSTHSPHSGHGTTTFRLSPHQPESGVDDEGELYSEPAYVHVGIRRTIHDQHVYTAMSKADAITVGQALIEAANELPDPFPFEDGDIVKGGAYSLVVVRNGRIEWFDGERYSLAEPDPSHFTKVGRLND